MDNVTPIRRNAPPPGSMLTELRDETAYRVACVLEYMSARSRDVDPSGSRNQAEDFGEFILLRELAAALRWAHEVAHG